MSMAPPTITFSFEGHIMYLSLETTAVYQSGNLAVQGHVRDVAQQHADKENAVCEVFGHNRNDYLFACSPQA